MLFSIFQQGVSKQAVHAQFITHYHLHQFKHLFCAAVPAQFHTRISKPCSSPAPNGLTLVGTPGSPGTQHAGRAQGTWTGAPQLPGRTACIPRRGRANDSKFELILSWGPFTRFQIEEEIHNNMKPCAKHMGQNHPLGLHIRCGPSTWGCSWAVISLLSQRFALELWQISPHSRLRCVWEKEKKNEEENLRMFP